MFCRKSVTGLAKSSNTQVNSTENQFGRNKSLSHWGLYQLGSFVYIKITKKEQFGEKWRKSDRNWHKTNTNAYHLY